MPDGVRNGGSHHQGGSDRRAFPLAGAIFDLDGTLMDTIPVVIKAFRRALLAIGAARFSDEEITALFGPTEAGVLRRAAPDRWQVALEIYQKEYQALFDACCIRAFPGLEAAVGRLRSRGVPTAIVTGKSAESAAFSLRAAGLQSAFDQVLAGSPEGGVKPALIDQALRCWGARPERVFYLGDSPSDMLDARQAGVIPLGAAWAETADQAALEMQHPEAIFLQVESFDRWLRDRLNVPDSSLEAVR